MKITNEIIDMVFESMPFGADGFLKNWGYRQFAHAIVAEATFENPTFEVGDLVRKKSGSEWQGRIVGFYSTELTPEGYAVESESHKGSVQIYPASALEIVV